MICSEDRNIYKPYLQLVNYAIEKFTKNGRKPVLLDAGCGRSSVLAELYKKCEIVMGVDMDKENLDSNILLDKKIYGNLTKVPLENSSIDIITSAWVFEHIKEPSRFLREMDRILRKNGYLLFIAPNRKSWFAFFASLIPEKAHGFINRVLYHRAEKDTFSKYYRLNTEKDIDKILVETLGYEKIQFQYNDDPKYLSFSKFTKPLAKIWNKIVMKDKNKKLRVHILGLYHKP